MQGHLQQRVQFSTCRTSHCFTAPHIRSHHAGKRGRTACVAAPSSTSTSKEGMIFPPGVTGSWDEGGVGQPVVRCFVGDNEERWFMWYSGRQGSASPGVDLVAPSAGSMGVAISSDGLNWVRGTAAVEGARGLEAAGDVGTSLTPNGDWWCFDTCHVAVSDVQVLSSGSVQSGVGVYWCFYAGGDFEAVQVPAGLPVAPSLSESKVEGMRMRPGLAMSQDARNWARIEGDHHTGALFDVGAPGEWDHLFIGHPQVVSLSPRDMRMYYHSWDQTRGRYVIGNATSRDGFKWDKKGVVFDPLALGAKASDHDGLGAAACSVVRDIDNRQYVMFYEAVASSGARSIGMAVSKDGNSWKRCPTPVLVANEDGSAWDAGSVGSPCGVSMSAGKWRLYYGGRGAVAAAPWQGIGLALSQEGGQMFEGVPTSYKRAAMSVS